MAQKKKKGTKKAPLKKISPRVSSTPKSFAQAKSVLIPLGKGPPAPSSTGWRASSSNFMHGAAVKVHHYSAIGFLIAAIWGFIFTLHFITEQNWLSFLIAMALCIVGVDKFMFSLRKKKEVLGEFHMPTMQSLHHLSAHVFLIFALIGFIFALTFWLKGQWLMLLFSAVILILGIDNMILAKKYHQGTLNS